MEQSEEIRQKLTARQQELENSLGRLNSEALDSGSSDVQDEIDRVTSAGVKATALGVGSREYQSLRDVQNALTRLDDGTYGRCVICGKEISPARLTAIPETPYCLEDAESADASETMEDPGSNL